MRSERFLPSACETRLRSSPQPRQKFTSSPFCTPHFGQNIYLPLEGHYRFSQLKPPNARHHPPPQDIIEDESGRVGGRVHAVVRWRTSLEELLEFFDRQTRIPDDTAHRKRIHWVMTRDREDADTIGHHDVLALTYDPEASLFQSSDRILVVNPGNLRHG